MSKFSTIRYSLKLCEGIRAHNNEIAVIALEMLMKVAESGETSISELADQVGITVASASRNIQFLSAQRDVATKGLGLVEVFENPYNRRQKLVKLSKKGEQFIGDMSKSFTSITRKSA